MSLLDRRLRAPPGELPWASPGDEHADACTEYVMGRLVPFGKNVLSWRPRDGADTLVVVVGDSYADDVDMGFETWPSELSRLLGSACVCTATGGTRSSHALGQLARAHAFLDVDGEGVRGESFPPSKRWLVVHTGGNDVLAALLFPPLLLLLWLDLVYLSLAAGLGWLRPPTRPHRWSFLGLVSAYSAQHLALLLRDAAARGHTRVLVARPPFSPSVPLARALSTLLLLGLPSGKALTATLVLAFRLFRVATDEAVARHAAEHPGMRLHVFDEPELLDRMAADHRADAFALCHVPGLISRRFRRNVALWREASPGARREREVGGGSGAGGGDVGGRVNGGGSADGSGGGATVGAPAGLHFWHDAHHPAREVHLALARHAAESLAD